MKLSDINFSKGCNNPSGIGTTIFFIKKSEITSWPKIEDPSTEAATVETATCRKGDFVLKTGATFLRFYSTYGKGKITFETIGEADCKCFTNKATLQYPKVTNDIRAFLKASANDDIVYLVRHDNKLYIVGSEEYPSITTSTGDSGDAAGSAKGITINIECPDETPMPVYLGEVKLADGTFDSETMLFTPKEVIP